MKYILLLSILCSFLTETKATNTLDSLLVTLDKTIAERDIYRTAKIDGIDRMKSALTTTDIKDYTKRYELLHALHHAYFTFDHDSAMSFALRMLKTAYIIGDISHKTQARITYSNTLLSSGYFEQTNDSLSVIPISALADSLKLEYFFVMARLNFEKAEYYQKSFFESYNDLGLQLLDSALVYAPKQSIERFTLDGLKLVRLHDLQGATLKYDSLFSFLKPVGRDFAINASTYGFALLNMGRTDLALEWFARAAIEDIKLSSKEYIALINLADLLYKVGNVDKSSTYLNIALEDAKRYGALQRNFQISQILPVIEAQRLHNVVEQKIRIKYYAYAVTLLLVAIGGILFALYKQLKKVRAVRNELKASNNTLRETNVKLREVNLINEKYIGHFFKTNSDLIDKLDNYRQQVENKVMIKKVNDLLKLLSKQDIKTEREKMYQNFDTVFLHIFPDFNAKFNALFAPEHQVENTEDVLHTDLRIFALIRLGIRDTEKIAHILNYSVHTINTYKTRIKNRSLVSNEEFENEILKIESI